MAGGKSEADLVDEAVEHAVGLVEAGDSPIVATNYAAEARNLQHREADIEERVREEVEDGDD